mmetsp:Transcript_38868/g.83728  ORF Transcript_38868/g.83728 Transcript_38868/m.83728 type:complete len:724 (+) Transcript_38868:671-2842(+)
MASAEWDDIPTSSELFGGDFSFGDELMEMYSAMGDAPSPSSALTAAAVAVAAPLAAPTEDDKSHPGLLIAMNAAAMDGGLSPLGSGPDQFLPMTTPSNTVTETATELPPYNPSAEVANVKIEPTSEAAAASPPAAPAFVPTAVLSAPAAAAAPVVAKRPVAAVAAPTPAQNPAKKLKGGAPLPAAVPRAIVAATGGIKVSLPPGTALSGTPATRPMGHATSSPSQTSTVPAPAPSGFRQPLNNFAAPLKNTAVGAPTAQGIKSTVIPRSKMPGGGINHQVVARPSMVQSSTAFGAHRVMPPAPSLSGGVKHSIGVRKPDLPPQSIPTGVIRAKSEADFKDVASAAVSSLIQNASSTLTKTGPKPPVPIASIKPGDKTVDVSTAHINALTSQNWVTACNPIPTPEISTSANSASACDKAARNARRATLTQEERAKQNRDRNREHARNTRLRKKAYVEELKRTLTELVAQRDAADLEKRHEAQRNREQREVRFRVMEEFLKLRGRNEPNAARWVAILEDGFIFTLPRTAFRRMVDSEKSANDVNGVANLPRTSVEQVLRGATVVMEDAQHLSSYLQSIGGPATPTSQVQIAYRCDRKRFFMDGNVAFMDFHANTLGAVAKGASNEATFKGSIRASFSPASNKLITVDVEFDTAAFVQQIEAMGDVSTAAAAVAAHEADALLDSLQMPQIFVDKKDVAAEPAPGPVSVSSDDGERSTDGSTALLNA